MHVVVEDRIVDVAGATHPNVVFLSPSAFENFLSAAKGDAQAAVAALQFTLAHEMAHLYLRHVVRRSMLLLQLQ